jgi:hypothetical protein
MRAVKVIVFGTLFSIIGIIGLLFLGMVIAVVRGPVVNTGSAATGLSALLAGLIEATVFHPVCWAGVGMDCYFGAASTDRVR